jgi:predicted ATP-dependent Lon-type protease
MTSESIDGGIDELLNRHFAGKVVRKDLTKLIKEGANVPVYVLESTCSACTAPQTTRRPSATAWRR